ncbi:DUF1499 domain-containing protein [Alkalimarinus sediminis]|uniref:DUF1499 domain-containing protein n=1 Tax=Alkalimarinus sediminis TaxID=1632866 RepID=A0A9E8HL45_9ALTE|nr:DUF1499 domain-containing protein [Alkalimarinus sediminis]UZW76620.1 DUF1499 domain-containing protein [Alkalimarinus sediminis]
MKAKTSPTPIKIAMLLSATLLVACTGTRPVDIGVSDNRLTPCPDSPNCVSSFEPQSDETHYISAYLIKGDNQQQTWASLKSLIEQNSSAEIIKQDEQYIYAEYTSSIMRFVDDAEFLLDKENNSVQLRSASRLGYKDFGVNRERLEAIRTELQSQDLVK